jgi:hypothetical protein
MLLNPVIVIVLGVAVPPLIIPVTVPKSAVKPSAEERSVTVEGPVLDLSHVKTNEVAVKEYPEFGVTIN